MRILQATHWFGRGGGMDEYMIHLADLLRGVGHHVAVAYGGAPGADASLPNVPTYYVPGCSIQYREDNQVSTRFLEVLKTERPDVVNLHINNPGLVARLTRLVPTVYFVHNHFLTCPSGTRLFRSTGRPCDRDFGPLCLWHGFKDHCNSYDPRKAIASYFSSARNRSVLRSVNRLLVDSPYMAETLLAANFRRDQVSVVTSIPKPTPRPELPYPAGSDSILFAGRVTPEKGLDVLLQASVLMTRPHRIKVAGDGWYAAKVRRLAEELGVAHRIDWLGWVPQEQLGRFYDAAAVVAFPSLWHEPLGFIGLEAMAHARPVVAFDVGGISTWLRDGENGYRVRPGDRRALAERLDLLLGDPAHAERLGWRGRAILEAEFTPQQHTALLLGAYHEAVQEFHAVDGRSRPTATWHS